MFQTILESMQPQGLLFWITLTLANTCLFVQLGYFVIGRFEQKRDIGRLTAWRLKYGFEAPEEPEAQTRLTGFAEEMRELCNRYRLNVESLTGIEVTDRTFSPWKAVFAGCDSRGVYNQVNPGWFE
jgi:hypothetical protein